jgi:hypothetical protein
MAIQGYNKIQELWTVKFEGSLAKGDCGSWVVDEQNHELFGHIVAGSPRSGVAYIVPTYQLIQDAKSTYGLELQLYTASKPIEETARLASTNIISKTPDITNSSASNAASLNTPRRKSESVYASPPHPTAEASTSPSEDPSHLVSKDAILQQINTNDEFLKRRKQSRQKSQRVLLELEIEALEDENDEAETGPINLPTPNDGNEFFMKRKRPTKVPGDSNTDANVTNHNLPDLIPKEIVHHRLAANEEFLERRRHSRLLFQTTIQKFVESTRRAPPFEMRGELSIINPWDMTHRPNQEYSKLSLYASHTARQVAKPVHRSVVDGRISPHGNLRLRPCI